VAFVARALLKHPTINATWSGDEIRMNAEVNMGVAMAVDGGVVAPVIRHAHKAELGEIAVRRQDLSERSRAGKLRPPDLTGGTFTLSNLGMYGVDNFSAIISSPQVAILAVGRIAERVVPVDGRLGIRSMMTFTLSSDHRVVDGARAAQFLSDLSKMIADPEPVLG
jgi:pyruvate dehydrogenase E2 component (dihydrolipoyllysine-residue acetyltransferase)